MKTMQNYINGRWITPSGPAGHELRNPATGELLAHVPFSSPVDVDQAAQAAFHAQKSWRRIPAGERIQYLFHMKQILETHFEHIAHLITQECGKTLDEARGEMRRAIENVEVACGIPALLQSEFSEDIAPGIDELMIRQPIGVGAAVVPFNFPGMITFWFMPYALACGNSYIVKPSEKVPLTMSYIFELFEALNLPAGVLNLVQGDKTAVDAILDHPLIHAVSFVGSTPVAKYIYSRASANGKRAQAQGGAKNPLIILPDADLEMTSKIAADSAFGCAGQRCLAASLAITVGSAHNPFTEAIADLAVSRVVGNGLDPQVQMGPVIDHPNRQRIEQLVAAGVQEGAQVLVDGRQAQIAGCEAGSFVRPTILQNLNPAGKLAQTEIFGPVLGIFQVKTVDEAIEFINSGRYGNMACLFTSSGAAARKFRYEAEVGNIGINIGVAAPMAFFPFSGWKESFFGTLHGQGRHAVEFFTQTKVVVERWPREWSRQF